MRSTIDLLTYHSDGQRLGSVFGGTMLALSALVLFILMVRAPRKPLLDQALTVKQFWLVLFGCRIVVANYWNRPSELWGTMIIVGLGVASIGVMWETLRARRNPEEAWVDPYEILADQQDEINQLKTINAELTRRLGMSVEVG